MRPTSYEARFERGRSATFATLGEEGMAVVADVKNPRTAAYVAEAGKPLRIVADPELFSYGDARKVEVVCRFEGQTDGVRLPISDGTRDMRTGALLCLPATFDVPGDARGKLRLSFEVTDKDGDVRSSWNPHYDAVIIPKRGATVVFDEQWGESVEGVVQAGQRLELAYDADRLKGILGTGGDPRMTACISFNGDPPLEVQMHVSEEDGGAPKQGLTALPAVLVPYDAHTVNIWFRGDGDGKTGWDSNLGKNYTLKVALPEPNSDPSWNKFISKVGFPNLKDNFDTLAPGDDGYNCIAWSLGLRDEWTWPGERVPDFDALYAKQGYVPLDDIDVSHDPALEKVALYGHALSGGRGEVAVTHAARMDEEGRWTSKLGTEPLIRHDDVNAVSGPSYGKLVRVYARPRPVAES